MEQPAEQPVKKKVYEAPKLVRYGDLLEATRATGTTSANSDNGASSSKTA